MSTQYDTPKEAAEDEREAFASHPSPVLQEVARRDTSSAVAFAGHPIHAMMVHFPIALVFVTLGIDLAYWWTGAVFWVEAGHIVAIGQRVKIKFSTTCRPRNRLAATARTLGISERTLRYRLASMRGAGLIAAGGAA